MKDINQGTLKIVANRMIDDKHFMLAFEKGELNPEAGQFIMIDCISQQVRRRAYNNGSSMGPLLKRPFSFYISDNNGELSILYKVKEWGKGTGLLPNLKEGDEIYYMGPLGTPIDIDKLCPEKETVHLIAGGVGIAPITFLTQKLIQANRKVQLYFGVPDLSDFFLFCLRNLESLTLNQDNILVSSESMHIEEVGFWDANTTTDESCNPTFEGYSVYAGGMIHAFIENWRYNIQALRGPVIVCAPEPVMRYVHTYLSQIERECYVFMEERMACGLGVCCGCNINGKLVCQQGPCLNSKNVFKE